MGVTLANTLVLATASRFSSSFMALSSAPVSTFVVSMPTCLDIVRTTASLSPDTTFTSIPWAWSCLMAPAADCLGGSRNARKPISTMPLSSSTAKLFSLLRKLLCATASTRSPWRFMRLLISYAFTLNSGVKGTTQLPTSVCEHICIISSTAPLVIICLLPLTSSTTTDILRRVKSKGISSTFL